jgi:1,4-alpha-glucan branching enzyme
VIDITEHDVEFCFFRPQAGKVDLVGDFNQWREGQAPMSRCADGYWRARLTLPPGKFRFRYRADGAWYTDFAAFGVESGPFGWNSVVVVAES